MKDKHITKKELISDFIKLGVEEGDIVALHSSLKSVGIVDGGAETVIDAILCALGGNGTLIVPAFTYSYSGKTDSPAFEKGSTPCLNMGIISETLRKRSTSIRSDNPSHSFAAIGKDAKALTENHSIEAPLGIGSPLHRLAEAGGKIILLGVGQNRNSSIHTAEAAAGMKYQSIPFRESWGRNVRRMKADGTEELITQHQFPGCSYNCGVLDGILASKGIVSCGMVGNAPAQIMRSRDFISEVVSILRTTHDFLLCNRNECECCSNRRAFLKNCTQGDYKI